MTCVLFFVIFLLGVQTGNPLGSTARYVPTGVISQPTKGSNSVCKLSSYVRKIFSGRAQNRTQDATVESKCLVTVAFVICGDENPTTKNQIHKLQEQLRLVTVSLKSIALAERYTGNILGAKNERQCIDVKLMVSRKEIYENIQTVVDTWDSAFTNFLKLSYVPANYPKGFEWMRPVYRPCSSIRLFLDKILPNTESVIFFDTDLVVLKSVQHLWAEFGKFTKETLIGMVPARCRPNRTEINGYDPHDYNTGVMLMNLTRMRAVEWTERIGMVCTLFIKEAQYAEQEMLVAYFKHFGNHVRNISCHWNFPPRNCRCGWLCAKDGISGVHGINRRFFTQTGGISSFKKFFRAFDELQLGQNFSLPNFISRLKNQTFTYSPKAYFCDAPQHFGNLVIKSVERFSKFKNLTPRSTAAGRNQLTTFFKSPKKVIELITKKNLAEHKCKITICLTFCEPQRKSNSTKQFKETLVLLKSLILMEKLTPDPKCINAIILSDNIESYNGLVNHIMGTWHLNYTNLLHFKFVAASYSKDLAWMKTIYRQCATVRLNYAELLPEYDAVIHLDTDMIFMRPPSELWNQFDRFDENTVMMMTPKFSRARTVVKSENWFGPTTLQSGVILMNLTRMRTTAFTTRAGIISTFFRKHLKLPVQVILEIYFRKFPEQISLLDSSWNILPHYCFREHQKKWDTISVLHGCDSTFTGSTFESVFQLVFENYQNIDMRNPDSRALLKNYVHAMDSELGALNQNFKSSCASTSFKSRFIRTLKDWHLEF